MRWIVRETESQAEERYLGGGGGAGATGYCFRCLKRVNGPAMSRMGP